MLGHFDLPDSFVEGVVPPVVRELLGRVVAHPGRVELEMRPDGFGDTLVGLSQTRS